MNFLKVGFLVSLGALSILRAGDHPAQILGKKLVVLLDDFGRAAEGSPKVDCEIDEVSEGVKVVIDCKRKMFEKGDFRAELECIKKEKGRWRISHDEYIFTPVNPIQCQINFLLTNVAMHSSLIVNVFLYLTPDGGRIASLNITTRPQLTSV